MNNFVYIETSKRTGSGVLLKCECDKEKCKEDEESYIVLTNYHVLQELEKSDNNQKKYIDLEIKDVEGEIISQKHIVSIFFACGNNFDNASDVAALLVVVKKICNVAYDNNVFLKNTENSIVHSKGYPHIFQDDNINRELYIEGKIEKFTKSGIGVYRITDDYHWYQDTPDKNLFDGLSGAPIYNDKNELVGINQSFCNIGGGKNPFKIVYFISIKCVLEWLRKEGIILFQYSRNSVKIVWIKDTEEIQEEKHIVLLGSSGAGKSSFLKSLCLHGREMDTSGDGQTTRSIVIYKLERFCQKPYTEIEFKNVSEFVDDNLTQIQYNLIEYICCHRFGMKRKNITADNMIYLRELLLPLSISTPVLSEVFKNKQKTIVNKIKETLFVCEGNRDYKDYEDKIIKCYGDVFNFLEEILRAESKTDGARDHKLLQMKYLFNKDKCQEESKTIGIQNYYQRILLSNTLAHIEDNNIEDDLKKIINETSGFFDVDEFSFLFKEGELREKCENWFNLLFKKDEKLIEDWRSLEKLALNANKKNGNKKNQNKKAEEIKKEGNTYEQIAKYYELVYLDIKDKLSDININIENEIRIFLEGITKEEQKFISQCVRKREDDSLTSIIKRVFVNDAISNEYAYVLYNKRVNNIFFYDTCGLDHINRGSGKELYFTNVFNEITDETKKAIDAILYIKKLDSGKPVELKEVMPIINRTQPSSPIYCVFSGMDQFLKGKEKYFNQIKWNKENYESTKEFREFLFPKALCDLYENDDTVRDVEVPQKIKNKIYRFIVNNVVPYSSVCNIFDDELLDINRSSIDKMFTSLQIDEWNTGFISIEKNKFEELSFIKNISGAIQTDLKNMFEIASERNWEKKHHMTIEANYRRIYRYDIEYDKKNPTLGFNRSQINRWDNLLQKGFKESFLSNGDTYKKLVEEGITSEKSYSILTRLREKTLLSGMNRWDDTLKPEEEKTPFRSLFEKMYKNQQSPYNIDPFERYKKEDENKNKNEKVKFLNDVCDFEKGLIPSILNEFVGYIMNEIKSMILEENLRCFKLLMENNQQLKNNFTCMKNILENYTGMEEKKSEEKIEDNIQFIKNLSKWIEFEDKKENKPENNLR